MIGSLYGIYLRPLYESMGLVFCVVDSLFIFKLYESQH